MCRIITFLVFNLIIHLAFPQAQIDEAADDLVRKYYNSNDYTKYRLSELDSAIRLAGQFLNVKEGLADKEMIAYLYAVRGRLQMTRAMKLDPDYTVKFDTITQFVESDLENAIRYCVTKECDFLYDLEALFRYTGDNEKLKRVLISKRKLRDPFEMPMELGLGIDYMVPKNIVGLSLNLGMHTRVKQTRWRDPETGKKFYPCDYMYPVAFGFLEAGVERCIDSTNYQAVKFSPIWLNFFAALNPLQFTYGTVHGMQTFSWRPEVGISYSTFSMNYCYNLPFNKKFTFVPEHSLTIKIVIPAIRWWQE